jgi:maltose-binding protein MalE
VETLKKDPDELRNLYVIASVAGQGPDLVFGPADTVGVLVTTETIRPLDDVFPAGPGEGSYLGRFVEEGIVRWNGRPWMLGDQVGNHLVLVCNRELVPEPPRTLEELVAVGKRLTVRGEDGRVERYGLTWNYQAPFFFVPFMVGAGGWVMDAEGRPTLDQAATVEALQFVLDLRKVHGIIPAEGDYQTASALFKEGKAAMIINGSWSWSDYGVPERSSVALLPVNGATGKRCAGTVSPNGYVVNRNVPDAKLPLIRSLLEHLTSDEVQLRMARELKILPSSRAVRGHPEVVADATLRVSAEQAAASVPMPVTPKMRQVWDGMTPAYQLIMNGELSAAEGARRMQRDTEKLYRDSQL